MACAAGLGWAYRNLSLAPNLVKYFSAFLPNLTIHINSGNKRHLLQITQRDSHPRAGRTAALRLYGSRQKYSLCISKYLPENALFGSVFLTFAWIVFKRHPPSVSYCAMQRKSSRLTFQITNSPAIYSPLGGWDTDSQCGRYQLSAKLHILAGSQQHQRTQNAAACAHAIPINGNGNGEHVHAHVCFSPFIPPHVERRANTYLENYPFISQWRKTSVFPFPLCLCCKIHFLFGLSLSSWVSFCYTFTAKTKNRSNCLNLLCTTLVYPGMYFGGSKRGLPRS